MAQSVNEGNDFEIKTVVLNTTTDTVVSFTNNNINSVLFRVRGTGQDIYMRRNAGDSAYFTIPTNLGLSVGLNVRTSTPFYLRASSGTPTIEILGVLE